MSLKNQKHERGGLTIGIDVDIFFSFFNFFSDNDEEDDLWSQNKSMHDIYINRPVS